MSVRIVGPFPAMSNEGEIYGDATTGAVLQFLGIGSYKDPLNWLVIGGSLEEDPDTTNWGEQQKGAFWYNKTTGRFRTWNGSSIENVGSGSSSGGASALVVFSVSGGVVTIEKASNVSDVTRNNVGDFTITFGEMDDALYAAFICGRGTAATSAMFGAENHDNIVRTTTQLRIYTFNDSHAVADPTLCSVGIFQ